MLEACTSMKHWNVLSDLELSLDTNRLNGAASAIIEVQSIILVMTWEAGAGVIVIHLHSGS